MFRLLVLIGLLLVVPVNAQDDPVTAVLEYIAEHQETTGIACIPLNDPEAGVYLNPDAKFPLASTVKLVVLAEYARQVTEGVLDPEERVEVDDVARYYLPNTDGGAHPLFLSNVRVEDGTIALKEVVEGMIRFSSNAATDYLVARLGAENFPPLYAQLGLENTDLPTNLLGLFLAFENHETGVADLDSPSIADEIERLSDLYLNDEAWREAEIDKLLNGELIADLDEQIAFFHRYGAQGSPEEFARLMAQLYTGDLISEDVSALMLDVLDWPMDFESNRARFDLLATKGGTMPLILTSAWIGKPLEGEPIALAIFYRDMPLETFIDWFSTFAYQQLEAAVIEQGCDLLRAAVG
jgi:D-alanyl-D-alanine carboxypeptidase